MKGKKLQCTCEASMYVFTAGILNVNISSMVFFGSKNGLCM
jgi:hypothetical protein